ncbi:MAG: dihydrofolate reductase [Clostridiales Family XIII bacterium]|jgi:dihydrofolate reductase|nr:dihydrofolate reductase [Clostridiales Family XIII bacterium]
MLNGIELIAIVAVDRVWGIGKGGQLPWRLSGDLAYFKEKTLGHAVVMGRRTFESLPGGALTGRENIVMTRQADYEPKGATVVLSQEELAASGFGRLYICGGEEIYRLLLPLTDRCLITKVDTVCGADAFFPDIDALGGFRKISESPPVTESGLTYRFTEYARE